MMNPSAINEKTLLLVDAGYFLTREIASAIQQEGHTLVVVTLSISAETPLKDSSPYDTFLDMIITAVEKCRPDALITINHLGFDLDGRLNDLLEALELPSLVWYVDSPRYIFLDSLINVNDRTGIFLWDDSYADWLGSLGFNKIHSLPLATDPSIFNRGDLAAAMPSAAPLVFVGDSMTNAVEKAIALLPDSLRPNLTDISEKIFSELAQRFLLSLSVPQYCKQPAWDVLKPIREAVKPMASGTTWSPTLNGAHEHETADWLLVESALVLLATKALRSKSLQSISQSPAVKPLTVYGDDGWKTALNGDTRILPSVDYYHHLADVYRQAGAILNVTGVQMPRGLNQRCFDVPAAGGLLFTDEQADIANYFKPGEEVVTFADSDE
ncbi:glycosyltransferase, partial [bacterium]|nr:glycosyltransferase [bacterium]